MDIQITDELLSKAQIAAWMYNQKFENSEGKEKPFTPKAFPGTVKTFSLIRSCSQNSSEDIPVDFIHGNT